MTPTGRATPYNSVDVSMMVSMLANRDCEFAVRSGGHMAWAGASNINEGVTIDLSEVKEISLGEYNGEKVVHLGPGARWGDVYKFLAKHDQVTPGANVASVGVGGFLLGGESLILRTNLPFD